MGKYCVENLRIFWVNIENIRNFGIYFEKTSHKFLKSFRIKKNVDRLKKCLGNILEILRKHRTVLEIAGNFEYIISSFCETSNKREILEKTWK